MANMFNEDGTYNKTEWKAGDKITAVKLNRIELSLEAINNNDIDRHIEADSRLDVLEERMANTPDNEQMDVLEDMVKDNKDAADLAVYNINQKIKSLESVNADSRLDALEGVNADSRLDALESVNVDNRLDALEYNLDNHPLYDIFPPDNVLDSMPMNQVFEVMGFYSKGDIPRTSYIKTHQTPNSIIKDGYYVKPINHEKNSVYLPAFGIREGSTYANSNSDVLSNIDIGFGATLYVPSGKFYFDRPIDLKTKQLSLKGNASSFNPDLNTTGLSSMFFYNLADGESAIISGAGSVSNIVLRGNPNDYRYSINRDNTYINKDNIETEMVNNKCIGISGGVNTSIDNVSVSNFYYGANLDSGNIYIHNIYFRACHTGLSVGSDTKCIGVYGWNIHTLLEIRSSLSSAIQVRADSCHHLVQLIGNGTSGVYLNDLDGDYCLGSVVRFGNADGSTQHYFTGITINGVTGRHACYNVYDTNADQKPTSSNITGEEDVSNWAFISAESRTNINGAIITVSNPSLSSNPKDEHTPYKTPPILFAHASGYSVITFITNFLNSYGTNGNITITKDGILDTLGLLSGYANAARLRFDMPSGTYYVRKVSNYETNVYIESTTTL